MGGRMSAAAVLGAALLWCAGCAVPQHKYNDLKEQYNRLLEENKRLTGENKDLQTRSEVLENQLKGEQARLAAAQDLLSEMNRERPAEAPKEGWKTNPRTGGIVLEDEIMFAAGSSSLSPQGKATLKRLAGILNGEKYRDYFVRVDGHTDDVPVAKTIKENIDNWFLSARRAHAVLTELKTLGVGTERLFLTGYGEHHPITPNKPGRAGTPANRRVEIVLVKEVKVER